MKLSVWSKKVNTEDNERMNHGLNTYGTWVIVDTYETCLMYSRGVCKDKITWYRYGASEKVSNLKHNDSPLAPEEASFMDIFETIKIGGGCITAIWQLVGVMVDGPCDAGVAYTRLFRLLTTTRHQWDHIGTSQYSTYTRKSRDRWEEGMVVMPYHRGNWDSGGSLVDLVTSLFHTGGRLPKVVADQCSLVSSTTVVH